MRSQLKKIQFEQQVVTQMITLYCRHQRHLAKSTPALCAECQALAEYARTRVERCRFGPAKPFCSQCPVHCYNPQRRQQIRAVMRYAGPRMLLYHPLLAISHLWLSVRSRDRSRLAQ